MKLSELDDKQLVLALNERWRMTESLWGKMKEWSAVNRKYWKNEWDDPNKSARKLSQVKDNRIFLSVEHDVNILTGRPAKPVVLPARQEDLDSQEVASGLQDSFLDLYRRRQVKKKLKKGIRNLHFDRLICLFPFWNTEINDVDVRVVDPKKVRIPIYANNEEDAEWIGEEIEEPILQAIEKYKDKEEEILKKANQTRDAVLKNNPNIIYRMYWTDEEVIYVYKDEVLKRVPNMTWDWQGLVIEPNELIALQELSGKARRPKMENIKANQGERMIEEVNPETGESERKRKEATYFYNHFDHPRKPYIFGTIFEDSEGPLGSTDLITQAGPLQDNVNRRKRQIDDNAEEASGIFIFDLNVFSKDDVQRFSGKAGSRLYGRGIERGFKRDVGRELPGYIFNDLEHSTREIDNLFATQGIVRGEKEGEETAAGRAMLREASLERRDEIIDLIDFVTWELYNWWFQLMKLNYTELHYVKPLGFDKAAKTIDLMQDDLEDGIDIKIIPGQIVPDDKIFRQEKAMEEVGAGLISPLDYYRAVGKENPEEVYKRLVLSKMNPAALVKFTPEELGQAVQGKEQEIGKIEESDNLAQLEAFLKSDEFRSMPPEQQAGIIEKVREKVEQLKK